MFMNFDEEWWILLMYVMKSFHCWRIIILEIFRSNWNFIEFIVNQSVVWTKLLLNLIRHCWWKADRLHSIFLWTFSSMYFALSFQAEFVNNRSDFKRQDFEKNLLKWSGYRSKTLYNIMRLGLRIYDMCNAF